MKLVGKSWQHAQQVTTAQAVVIELPASAEFTVAALPGGGGTALVETTCATSDELRSASASIIWRPWAQGIAGTINAAASEGFTTPRTAIRVTATTQPCRVELVQRADVG